jgi:transposase
VYFRLLLVGYFEGIDSERGIAWRVADSMGLRRFLGYELTDQTPDHSTISRNRRLIDVETHEEIFVWIMQVLAKAKLLDGKTLGVDATTLEANAALRSIVRRDTPRPAGSRRRRVRTWPGSTKAARTRARTTTGRIRTTPTRRSRR